MYDFIITFITITTILMKYDFALHNVSLMLVISGYTAMIMSGDNTNSFSSLFRRTGLWADDVSFLDSVWKLVRNGSPHFRL